MASHWTDGTAMYDAPTGLDTGFEQIVKEVMPKLFGHVGLYVLE
jgi:hypothetical protein